MDNDLIENLTSAVLNGRTDIIRTLLHAFENGHCDINKELSVENLLSCDCNEDGTLLHIATKLDYVDIVRTLLSAGADPSRQNSARDTPFDIAKSERMTTVYVEELLKSAAQSNLDRIQQLIASGVNVNSLDSQESGNTPLHWAASFGNAEAVQLLLDNGASVNVANADGASPLHDAVNRKNIEITRKLLNAGADPLHKSIKGKYAGKSPRDLASGMEEITNLLNTHIPAPEIKNKANNGFSNLKTIGVLASPGNDLTASMSHISLLSTDSPAKQSVDSYFSQKSSELPSIPHLTTPPALVTDGKLYLLWPQPQKIIQTGCDIFKLKESHSVQIIQSSNIDPYRIIDLWTVHEANFSSVGIQLLIDEVVPSLSCYNADIICCVNDMLFEQKESYKITTNSNQIKISSGSMQGLHCALCTLGQLFRLYKTEEGIPSLFIHDWPMLQSRAVLLDMSPGARKPTMDTLKEYVRILSSLKIKQLHYYFIIETKKKPEASYISRDLIEFARYCSKYYVIPVPAIDVPPDMMYEDLMDYDFRAHNLMALFSTRVIHLGPCLSKIVINVMLQDMSSEVLWKVFMFPPDSVIYLCSQDLHKKIELSKILPLNVILIEYGYQAEHDFDFPIQSVIQSGLNAYVGVGTSSWNSIAGCPDTAINNIYKGAHVATCYGAHGLIVFDWAGSPHHTPLCFSWPALLLTAGLAWNSSTHLDYLQHRLPELLNYHVLRDSEQVAGYLMVELGRLEAYAHQVSQVVHHNITDAAHLKTSILHQLLVEPDSVLIEYLKTDLFQQIVRHLKRFELDLHKAKPDCFQSGEVIAELQLAIDLLVFSCRLGKLLVSTGQNPGNSPGVAVINVGVANLPSTARTDLANRLLALTEQFRAVWLSRNLPCGLHSSLFLFNTLLHKLIPENNNYLYANDSLSKQKLFIV